LQEQSDLIFALKKVRLILMWSCVISFCPVLLHPMAATPPIPAHYMPHSSHHQKAHNHHDEKKNDYREQSIDREKVPK
jgi:hypothetical protein